MYPCCTKQLRSVLLARNQFEYHQTPLLYRLHYKSRLCAEKFPPMQDLHWLVRVLLVARDARLAHIIHQYQRDQQLTGPKEEASRRFCPAAVRAVVLTR